MTDHLRIAMFVGTFPMVSETFIVRQITGLLALGHEVDIYSNSRPDPNAPVHPEVSKNRLLERTTYMDAPSETIDYELPIWPPTGRTWPPGSATSVPNSVRMGRALPKFLRCLLTAPRLAFQVLSRAQYGYQAASLSGLYRLAKLCAVSKGYDVLHAHFGPVANSFRFARRLWRAPLCASFHGYDFSTLPRQQGSTMYRDLFATADAITVNSNYTRQRVTELGCPPDKLHLLPVGLSLDEFPFRQRTHKPGEPVRVLTVARLVEIKGHEYVVRAIAKVRQRHDILYDIVGDGPLRQKLESLIAELKLVQVVKLHGSLNSASIKPLMDRAHVFVLASVSIDGDQEGQGLVLQEAQAAGLPVIATNHGALPEGILPGESGFVVPERDVDALAERLNFLVEHPQMWPILGQKGRSFVEMRYDIGHLSRQLGQIYERVIAQKPQSF